MLHGKRDVPSVMRTDVFTAAGYVDVKRGREGAEGWSIKSMKLFAIARSRVLAAAVRGSFLFDRDFRRELD